MAEHDGKVSLHVAVARDVWDDELQREEFLKEMWRRLADAINERGRHPLEEPTISIYGRGPMHGNADLGMSQDEWDSIEVTMTVATGAETSTAARHVAEGLDDLFRRLGPPPRREARRTSDGDGEGND